MSAIASVQISSHHRSLEDADERECKWCIMHVCLCKAMSFEHDQFPKKKGSGC